MTLAMPDSVTVPDLPGGYDAYLGYADGTWPTAAALHAKFPAADLLILTVTGQTLQADGCDVETGDLTPEGGARWAVSKRAAYPGFRPVMYASVSGTTAHLGAFIRVGREKVCQDAARSGGQCVAASALN